MELLTVNIRDRDLEVVGRVHCVVGWDGKLGAKREEAVVAAVDDFNPFLATEDVVKEDRQPPPKKKTVEEYSMGVLPQDTVLELKYRIHLVTGHAAYTQHLYCEDGAIGYRIVTGSQYWVGPIESGGENIEGMPIDMQLANTRDAHVVVDEERQTVREMVSAHGTEYSMIILDDWLVRVPTDEYQRELVYYGMVLKYWPMLTQAAYQGMGDADWRAQFTELIMKRAYLLDQLPILTPLVDMEELKELVGRDKKDDKKGDKTSDNKFILWMHSVTVDGRGEARIHIPELFTHLHTMPGLPIIQYRTQRYRATRILRAPDSYVENLYAEIEKHLAHIPQESITVILDGNPLIIFTIGEMGYKLRALYSSPMSHAGIQTQLADVANPLIRQINEMGRLVFNSSSRLVEISRWTRLRDIEMELVWSGKMGSGQWSHLGEMLQRDIACQILGGTAESSTYRKGLAYQPLRMEAQNQYEWLTTRFMDVYLEQRRGVKMEWIHRLVDVVVRVYGIAEVNIEEWRRYVMYVLGELSAIKVTAQETVKGMVNVQALKSKDPVLFAGKSDDDVVYSRICQKSHQPVAYTDDEWARYKLENGETGKAGTKYWNFTTEQPMWYTCPTDKYPYLSFITGRHKQGYCLPCCKKTPAKLNVQSCLNKVNGTTDSGEVQTSASPDRYVYNYGKQLVPGRLGHLPDIISKYLQYITISNTKTAPTKLKRGRPTVESTDAIRRRGYYIVGVEQHWLSWQWIGALHAVSAALGRAPELLLPANMTQYLLIDNPVESSEEINRQIMEIPQQWGFQTILVEANGEDIYVERLGARELPAIVIFRRAAKETAFGNQWEYYPIMEINELVYFRDGSVETSIYGPEHEFLHFITELVDQRGIDLTAIVGLEVMGQGATMLKYKYGGQVGYLPLVDGMKYEKVPHLTRMPRSDISITAKNLHTLLTQLKLTWTVRIEYKDMSIGVETAIGWCYHYPIKGQVARGIWGEAHTITRYDPDEIMGAVAKQKSKPSLYDKSTKPAEERVYESVLLHILDHLDRERDGKLRGALLNGEMGALLPDEQIRVQGILQMGLAPAEERHVLDSMVFTADHHTMHHLLELHGPALRAQLLKLLKSVACPHPGYTQTEILDLLVADFSNPNKRKYFSEGIYIRSHLVHRDQLQAAEWERLYIL
jgi:hypothetical protein